jgi:glycosyltransferase involved in cell wall biosynthesis
MRVLHCIWRMGLGGTERQLVQLARALRKLKVEVLVATVFHGDLDDSLAAVGVETPRVTASHKYDPRVLSRLVRLIRRVRPDVVQTWLTQMDIIGGTAAALTRVPWILSERSSRSAYPPSLLHRTRRLVGSRARAIVANSEGGRHHWAELVDGRVPIYVIPNIVPQEEIDAATALEEAEGADVILYVGRLSPEKNLATLLVGIARVMRRRDATAVFCGDGVLRSSLEALALELGIAERVRFLGGVNDVWSWMKSAAVVVSVSSFEGNPNAVLEAIAAGAPLVCSDIPAHREIVNEGCAWLVDGTSPESIAGGILAALGDVDEARARAARAQGQIEARSAAIVASQYERLYREISSGRETR